MRSLTVCLMALALCTAASSQNITIPKDSLDKIIQGTFNKMLEDRSYTRIPNSQFDDIMVTKISSTIDDKFKTLYWYVGFIGFILASLLFYSGNRFLKDSVKDKFDKESAAIQETIQKNLMTEISSDVQKIKQEMEDKLKEVNTKLANSEAQIAEAKKEILNIRIEKIKTEEREGKLTEETFKSLMKSLKEAEDMIDNTLTEEILLLLSTASYSLAKETNMEDIVQTYMKKENIQLDPSIFLNLASGFFLNYYSTQDEKDKQKSQFYVNESLKKLSTYGEAYALKLELLMFDYSRLPESDNEAKQKIINEATHLMQLSGDSAQTALFFVQRYNRVGTTKPEAKYFDLLKTLFPEEWKNIFALGEVKTN